MANRVSQAPVEIVELPTSANARATQGAVEAVLLPTSANARASQGLVEVVLLGHPPAKITQAALEVVYLSAGLLSAVVSQAVVEVVWVAVPTFSSSTQPNAVHRPQSAIRSRPPRITSGKPRGVASNA